MVDEHAVKVNKDRVIGEKHPSISWCTPTSYSSLGPIGFKLRDIPEQEFALFFPECFTARDIELQLRPPTWTIKTTSVETQVTHQPYAYRLAIQFAAAPTKLTLMWQYRFENASDTTLQDLAAFNCFYLDKAPLFKDLEMSRTWVLSHNGERVPLKTIQKTKGKRTMQFYPVAGGIDLSQVPWIAGHGVTSNEALSGNSIKVVSKDGQWLAETLTDGPVAYFFNNWELDHGCIHAAPLLGTVGPGQQVFVSGSVNFIKI